ncbi:MAG: hypothetical protein NTV33_13030 [Coprothermobacterota bacterium]|nr:hypothetical protein [Coprothermobacterota bacterium]
MTIPGTAAPQCGKPGIGIFPGTETTPGTIGFPGSATPSNAISAAIPGLIGLFKTIIMITGKVD